VILLKQGPTLTSQAERFAEVQPSRMDEDSGPLFAAVFVVEKEE
jgi:hypothetical protein